MPPMIHMTGEISMAALRLKGCCSLWETDSSMENLPLSVLPVQAGLFEQVDFPTTGMLPGDPRLTPENSEIVEYLKELMETGIIPTV